MVDRVIEIYKRSGLSQGEFAELMGVSASTFSHLLSGRNKTVNTEALAKIKATYPTLTWEWLLEGKGELDDFQIFSPKNVSPASKEQELGLNFEHAMTEERALPPVVTPVSPLKKEEKTAPAVSMLEVQPDSGVKITQICVYFDNGTYEIFVPKRNV